MKFGTYTKMYTVDFYSIRTKLGFSLIKRCNSNFVEFSDLAI